MSPNPAFYFIKKILLSFHHVSFSKSENFSNSDAHLESDYSGAIQHGL